MNTLRQWMRSEELDIRTTYILARVGLSRLRLKQGALLTFTLEATRTKQDHFRITYPKPQSVFVRELPFNPDFEVFCIHLVSMHENYNVGRLVKFVNIAKESDFVEFFKSLVRTNTAGDAGLHMLRALAGMGEGSLNLSPLHDKISIESLMYLDLPNVAKIEFPDSLTGDQEPLTTAKIEKSLRAVVAAMKLDVGDGLGKLTSQKLNIGPAPFLSCDLDGGLAMVTLITELDTNALGSSLQDTWLRAARCLAPGCERTGNIDLICGADILPSNSFIKTGCAQGMYCSRMCYMMARPEHMSDCRTARFTTHHFEPFEYTFRCHGREFMDNFWAKKKFVEQSRYDYFFENRNLWMVAKEDGPEWERLSKDYAWGQTPPRDLLTLARREGTNYDKTLSILLTKAEDMRHVLKTVVELPKSFQQPLMFTINEEQFHNQLRNLVITLLALMFPGGEASELCVHIWYSGRITQTHHDTIQQYIMPLFRDVVQQLKSLPENSAGYTKAWKIGSSVVKATFTKMQWSLIWIAVNPARKDPDSKTWNEQWNGTMFVTKGPDLFVAYRGLAYNEKCELFPIPVRRQEYQYRERAVLLPFESECRHMQRINPFMFNFKNELMMNPLSSVLDGFDPVELHRISTRMSFPRNDLHGIIFFQTRNTLKRFSRRCATASFTFDFKHAAAIHLPQHLRPDQKFDRIEISSLVDHQKFPSSGTTGTNFALKLYKALLKDRVENPSAMITALYSTAVQGIRDLITATVGPRGNIDIDGNMLDYSNDMDWFRIDHREIIDWYIKDCLYWRPSEEAMESEYLLDLPISEPSKAKYKKCIKLWLELCVRQDEKMWELYCQLQDRIEDACNANEMKTNKYEKRGAAKDNPGLKCLENWPYWVDVDKNGECSEHVFSLRFAGRMKGSERLVEFVHMDEEDLNELVEMSEAGEGSTTTVVNSSTSTDGDEKDKLISDIGLAVF